jgi:hypothetical protein
VIVGPGESTSVAVPAGFSLLGSAIPFSGGVVDGGNGTLISVLHSPIRARFKSGTGLGMTSQARLVELGIQIFRYPLAKAFLSTPSPRRIGARRCHPISSHPNEND